MARFHGNVGFVKSTETEPGVWENVEIERPYYGDIVRSARRWDLPTEVSDRLNLSNEINLVADDYAMDNMSFMRYVVINGQKWNINYIEVNRPRIRLTLGGVYSESE